jgi:hypothetical protein
MPAAPRSLAIAIWDRAFSKLPSGSSPDDTCPIAINIDVSTPFLQESFVFSAPYVIFPAVLTLPRKADRERYPSGALAASVYRLLKTDD